MTSLLSRRWWRVGMVAVATAGVAAWLAMAWAAPDEAAEKEAASEAAAEETFEVPEGSPAELLEFIDKVKAKRPEAQDPQAMREFMRNQSEAIMKAADKILAADPTAEQQEQAVEAKMRSLSMLLRSGAPDARRHIQELPGQLGPIADKILADKPDAERADKAVEWKMLALNLRLQNGDEEARKEMEALPGKLKELGLTKLARRVESSVLRNLVMGAGPAEREKYLDKVYGYLEEARKEMAGAKIDPDDIRPVMGLLQVVERVGDPAKTAALYKGFAETFSASEDENIASLGKSLAGVARRLGLIGNKMELEGTTVGGEPFDWSAYRGKVVLVDFWATWCGPCRAEMPNVKENYERYHDKGFDVVGISLDRTREALEGYLEENNIPWTILYNEDEEAAGPANPAEYYGIQAIPTVMLVDKEGKVVTFEARGPALGRNLEKLLGPAEKEGEVPKGANQP